MTCIIIEIYDFKTKINFLREKTNRDFEEKELIYTIL